MKNLIKILVLILLYSVSYGQTLINQNITGISGSSIVKPGGIYFNGQSSSSGIYFLDQNEMLTLLLPGATIQFEYDNHIYAKNSVEHSLHKISLVDNSVSQIFDDSNIFIISSTVVPYNDKLYFVGYDIGQTAYYMMSFDLISEALLTYGSNESYPGPVQNTNRLHEDAGFLYHFTNTLSPNAQHHYKYNINSGGPVVSISAAEYAMHPYPFDFGLSEVSINGEIFTINTNGQLTSNLSSSDLTCFELAGEEGPASPQLVGNIDENVYMVLAFNIGSPNGLYRFPEDLDNGLCGPKTNDACKNTVMDFDGIDDRITFTGLTSTEEFTVGAWFKASNTPSGGAEDRILSFGPTNRLEIGIKNNGSLWMYDQLGSSTITNPPNVRDDVWHHIAFVNDGNEKRIYLDFNEIATFTSSSNLDYGPNFAVGAWTGGAGNTEFSGRVDDVKLFSQAYTNGALTDAFYNTTSSNDLLLYADFEEGVGNGDNTSIATVMNNAGGINGTIQNVSLTDSSSNYVCSFVFEIPENCTEECAADVVNLNTGIDFADDSELPIGSYEGGWQLIASPDDGVSLPRPSYVLHPQSPWDQLPGTQYISPYQYAGNNQSFSEPYVFERCFCVCEPSSEVNLDISAYFDNFLNLGLYDSEGNLIDELIDYQFPPSTSTFTGDAYTSNTTYDLNTGTYCLRAGLRNDGAVIMGLAIQASITGVGLIENGCCSRFAIATGTVYQDEESNSDFDQNYEEGISEIEVQLCNEQGALIQSETTDIFGYYSFYDIEPGSYIVKVLPGNGQELTEGSGGYSVEIFDNKVVGDLDFGISPPENCTEECAADVVNLNTGIDFADDSELPIGAYEGGWQLIASPDDGVSFPRPSYVLDPNSVWAQLPGTQYISPYPNAENNQTFSDPYVFERCFCVCEPNSDVNLDIAAYFDNFLTLGLYDSEGNLIEELINYTGSASTSTFTGDPYTSNTSYSLNTGTYCLRAELRNDGAVTMGLAIQASVSGVGLIENGCCTPFTIVTGTVYQDENCNGSFAAGSEEALPDVEIQLCDTDGNVIMTTTTDIFGYYSFFDVGEGSFTVKYTPSGDQELSEGSDGYTIDVGANSVSGDLDFGVCPPENCTEECAADIVNLNTGIDFADDSELPIGAYEGGWQLIASPDDGVSFPRPSYVLDPNSVWAQLPGTQYISPYPDAENNQTFSDPYVFERCFCVCEPSSDVNLDVAAYFDNFLTLGLYDSEGNLIEELINYTGSASTATFTGDPYTSNTSYSLNTGTYCLRAELRNDGAVTMGLAIQASVSGVGLIENGCCTPFTIVTGTVYQDDDCNGAFAAGSEEALPDVEVQLCDTDGNVIMTTTTDIFGYYSFFDVGEGAFTVKYTPSGNQELSEGEAGYAIDVSANSVSGDLDFGVCPDPCLEDTTPPNCVLPSGSAPLNINGVATITAEQFGFASSDECGEVILELDKTTFTCEDIGNVTITLTVTDESGNTSSCSNIVVISDPNMVCDCINDETPPDLTCPSGTVEFQIQEIGQIEINQSVFDITAIDNCTEVNLESTPSVKTCDNLGQEFVFTVFANDENGNQSSCEINYIIVDNNEICQCLNDTEPPTVQCSEELISISLDNSGEVNLTDIVSQLISATDDCDEDVSMTLSQAIFNCENVGQNEIIVSVTDDSGNNSTCSITIIIEDKLSPQISCSGGVIDLEINQDGFAEIGDSYLNQIDATDECGIESYAINTSSFNCDQLGLNEVTVEVIDNNGNVSQCILVYNVIDNDGYCKECCGTSEELTAQTNEEITVTSLICNDNDEFTLDKPDLLECQFISKISWGDGTVNSLNNNDPIPSHKYSANSVYLISIEVTSIDGAGNICQVDNVNLPIVYKNCIVGTIDFEEIDEYRLKIYPIPAKENINIDLSKNPNGFNTKVYNNLGQLINQFSIDSNIKSHLFDSTILNPGVYNFIFEEIGTNTKLECRFIKI